MKKTFDISQYFDSSWYLLAYPDVAIAGADPLQHYKRVGRSEGRLPFRLEALELEQDLWSSEDPKEYLDRLIKLFDETDEAKSAMAGWVLGRWYGSFGNWDFVTRFLPKVFIDPLALYLIAHQGPYLLLFDAYFWLNKHDRAQEVLESIHWHDSTNKCLAGNMLLPIEQRVQDLSLVFSNSGLCGVGVKSTEQNLDFDNIKGFPDKKTQGMGTLFKPLVSIIIPCFNAQETLITAIASLLEQTWKNLEIIVVDDASNDCSWEMLQKLSLEYSQLRIFRQKTNLGAYRARNYGLSKARGKYITVHDIDDWSHPQKIELQVNAIQRNRHALASISFWVRADSQLNFQRWRMEDGWIYRNVSSLMFKRKVFRRLGYWDNVSVNADTEYYFRILARFHSKSIVEVLPNVPLSFGRASNESLSQTKASHLRTQFKGLRKNYHDAATSWHKTNKRLYLDQLPDKRPFVAPVAMIRGSDKQRIHNLFLLVKQTDLFNDEWYLKRYPDIASAKVEPLWHYLNHGVIEGRDLSPTISISGLAYKHGISKIEALEALVTQDSSRDFVTVKGKGFVPNRPAIICVGHMVSTQVFGAERSFLDTLRMLSEDTYNVIVVLPNASNYDYVDQVTAVCQEVVFQPLKWWQKTVETDYEVTQSFSRMIEKWTPLAVLVNTLVLAEPLIAAKQNNIPSFMQVRELPHQDPDLCKALLSDPGSIRLHCLQLADYFIANSQAVFSFINAESRSVVVPNVLPERFLKEPPKVDSGIVVVSIISSNLPKKGIEDFLQVATALEPESLAIEFRVYGPENEYTQEWKKCNELTNVRWMGYCSDPKEALIQTDILVNLSHFQESFGRSVLEGMACECAIVAYDWGALSELIDEKSGILVSYKNVDGVISAIRKLATNPGLIKDLGRYGRVKAIENYRFECVKPLMLYHLQENLPTFCPR